MDVDDTDRAVVNALLADGRASVHDVSAATGIAVPVVEQRLDALERRGVVGACEPVVDYEAFGFDVTAILHVTAARGERDALAARLAEDDRLTTVYQVAGDDDVFAVGKFRDVASLNERIGSLVTAPEVRDLTTDVVRETVREGVQFSVDAADS